MEDIKDTEILKAMRNDLLIKYAVVRTMAEKGVYDTRIYDELSAVRKGLSEAITAIDLAIK